MTDYTDEDFDEEYDEEEEAELLPCPNCGVEIYEDAPQCHACGEYITHSTNIFQGKSKWWIALGIAGMLALACAILAGQFIGR